MVEPQNHNMTDPCIIAPKSALTRGLPCLFAIYLHMRFFEYTNILFTRTPHTYFYTGPSHIFSTCAFRVRFHTYFPHALFAFAFTHIFRMRFPRSPSHIFSACVFILVFHMRYSQTYLCKIHCRNANLCILHNYQVV